MTESFDDPMVLEEMSIDAFDVVEEGTPLYFLLLTRGEDALHDTQEFEST